MTSMGLFHVNRRGHDELVLRQLRLRLACDAPEAADPSGGRFGLARVGQEAGILGTGNEPRHPDVNRRRSSGRHARGHAMEAARRHRRSLPQTVSCRGRVCVGHDLGVDVTAERRHS